MLKFQFNLPISCLTYRKESEWLIDKKIVDTKVPTIFFVILTLEVGLPPILYTRIGLNLI